MSNSSGICIFRRLKLDLNTNEGKTMKQKNAARQSRMRAIDKIVQIFSSGSDRLVRISREEEKN